MVTISSTIVKPRRSSRNPFAIPRMLPTFPLCFFRCPSLSRLLLRTEGEVKRSVELGPKSLRLTVMNGEEEIAEISASQSFRIQFSKGSGAFLFDEEHPAFTSLRIEGNRAKELVIYGETRPQ